MKIKNQELRKQFIDVFRSLTQRYNSHQVWSDFVIMSACTISNACDLRFYKEREEMYMDTVKRYKKEELDSFCEMLSLLIMALTEEPCQDFLGEIYCNLRLANGQRGQVFTPYHVAEMMARMMVSGKINDITEKGNIADPCCGGGCMLIAYANVLKSEGINYQQKILFVGQDIDMIAGLMCYIQLSLLGCRCIIKIGDSLSDPFLDKEPVTNKLWFSPMYMFGDALRLGSILSAMSSKEPKEQSA